MLHCSVSARKHVELLWGAHRVLPLFTNAEWLFCYTSQSCDPRETTLREIQPGLVGDLHLMQPGTRCHLSVNGSVIAPVWYHHQPVSWKEEMSRQHLSALFIQTPVWHRSWYGSGTNLHQSLHLQIHNAEICPKYNIILTSVLILEHDMTLRNPSFPI